MLVSVFLTSYQLVTSMFNHKSSNWEHVEESCFFLTLIIPKAMYQHTPSRNWSVISRLSLSSFGTIRPMCLKCKGGKTELLDWEVIEFTEGYGVVVLIFKRRAEWI